MRKIFIVISFFFIRFSVFSQFINIGLYNDQTIQTVVFSPSRGTYNLIADGEKLMTCKPGGAFYVTMINDSLRLISEKKDLGMFLSIHFMPVSDTCFFSIKPVYPALSRRCYDDGISLKVQWKRIRIINQVELDRYIAGVVQSEGGTKAHIEYYKTQAVLCRTYIMRNFTKHADEGFNLCDGVHCQAYLNRGDKNPAILEAAFATKNQVAVDDKNELILAVFHSNCGGVTENCENVWPEVKDYLRSVNDPYCQNQKNSRWEKTISPEKWKEYLKNNGFKSDLDFDPSYFNFTQYERKLYYKLKNDSILLRKIRTDWNLKSTFFSIHADGGKLVFSGRGYGHGVGLCQEGAMQMAKLGYNYTDILNFYFKQIQLVDFHKLEGVGGFLFDK
jgi:stage II sporulation protein D